MKLIFVKNLKNKYLCNYIFKHLLLVSSYKSNTLSFIKEFKMLCSIMNEPEVNIIVNIEKMIIKYKYGYLECEKSVTNASILKCLQNSSDWKMRQQQNNLTYVGPRSNITLNDD